MESPTSQHTTKLGHDPRYAIVFAGDVYKHALHDIYHCVVTARVDPERMARAVTVLLQDFDNHARDGANFISE